MPLTMIRHDEKNGIISVVLTTTQEQRNGHFYCVFQQYDGFRIVHESSWDGEERAIKAFDDAGCVDKRGSFNNNGE
mgnify:CR=1 FL=1